jgi:hypothetical protein
MSYAKSLLGKDLTELTIEDIEIYFSSERVESNIIEFKSYESDKEHLGKNNSSDGKMNGVMRTICAMLNTSGGLIIWGAPRATKVDGQEDIFTGKLSPVPHKHEKDRFIGSVSDRITPTPANILFQPLFKGGDYVYVIEIQQSPYAPHQFRGVYEMRLDGQTRVAPHFFVEALFRKITYPNLSGFIRFDKLSPTQNRDYSVLTATFFIFNLSELQNEHNIYVRFTVDKGVFQSFLRKESDEVSENGFNELRFYNTTNTLYYNEPLQRTFNITFGRQHAENPGSNITLTMYFGGKNSPLKLSLYHINLYNFNGSRPDDCVRYKQENEDIRAASTHKNLTQQDKMDLAMGRIKL